jgi:hypothetical protein
VSVDPSWKPRDLSHVQEIEVEVQEHWKRKNLDANDFCSSLMTKKNYPTEKASWTPQNRANQSFVIPNSKTDLFDDRMSTIHQGQVDDRNASLSWHPQHETQNEENFKRSWHPPTPQSNESAQRDTKQQSYIHQSYTDHGDQKVSSLLAKENESTTASLQQKASHPAASETQTWISAREVADRAAEAMETMSIRDSLWDIHRQNGYLGVTESEVSLHQTRRTINYMKKAGGTCLLKF